MNQTTIDNKLYECQKIADRERMDGNKEYFRFSWALMVIQRYINTGRASVGWLKKFVAADTEKLMQLAAKYSGSDDKCLLVINSFLLGGEYETN